MAQKTFHENVSQGFNRVMKIFSYQDPFQKNLYYVRYKMNGQEYVGTANGKDGADAARDFAKRNPNAKVNAYRRFSMHLGLAEQWHSCGGN